LEAAIASSSADRARAELADLQERLEQETDPEARRALVEQRRSLRDVIERQTAQEQDERRRAADVSALLNVEAGKLNDLTQSLDDLERGLDNLVGRPAGPARQGGNP
jgi:vacuolar-type H+-ATPase subunit E/Vma4